MLLAVTSVFVLLTISWAESDTSPKTRVYRGTIIETAAEGDEVVLNVPLSVSDREGLEGDEICGYTVYKWHSELPFKVVLADRKTGDAKIVLAEGGHLDYEVKHKYSFDIAAYDCQTGAHARRERVNIYVDDANEFSPIWNELLYSAVVDEGPTRREILQVQATDADGSPGLSKICQYHIMTPGVPFDVDDQGVVRNTEPLDAQKTEQYTFQVKAEDCGGRVSEDAVVNVAVRAICKRGLNGVQDVQVVDTTRQQLMPDASLDVCDATCQPERVSVTIRLQSSHIGRGCDRDQFSLVEQRQICGASRDFVDLLPNPNSDGSWTTELPTVDDIGDDVMFVFDGQTTAVEVPAGELDPVRLGTSFSIATWMKHERSSGDSKEHIVCAADGEGMNRHHYALFVHKCRLVLLLRHEPELTSATGSGYTGGDTLSPAEWRWKLPEVCDGRWHHYVVTVQSLQVKLHLDGRLFVPMSNEPEVLDDWPLHRSKLVHSSKLYVGACWQGAKNSPGQHFRGYLSGLVMMRNASDSDDAIECLNRCQEKLELSAMDVMDTGTSVSMNAGMNLMTINGLNVDSVQRLMRQISYVNTRLFPTPAVRPLSAETHIKCTDGRQPVYDVINVSVDVTQTDTLVLSLNGTSTLGRDERHILVGDKIFFDLVIAARQKQNEYDDEQMYDGEDISDRLRIGTCHVHLEPGLNIDTEQLTYPEEQTEHLGMQVTTGESGLTISGSGTVAIYQDLLRQVRYVNMKPHDLNHRTFVLGCTEMAGRLTSNLLHVNLDVVRVVHEKAPAPQHVMKEPRPIMADTLHLVGKSFPSTLKYDSQQTGIGVAVVMVVCVGFIVVLVVLGVMRVRNARRCGSGDQMDDKQDLDWDNSALTITVNPMDPDNVDVDDRDGVCTDDEDSDDLDSDDGVVYRDPVATNVEANRKLHRCDWRKDGSTLIL